MNGSADSVVPPISEPEPTDDGEPRPEGSPSKAPAWSLQGESLHTRLAHLMAENGRLHGKLRGYQTLNQLFQEVKEECSTLRKENQNLKESKGVTSKNPYEKENVVDLQLPHPDKSSLTQTGVQVGDQIRSDSVMEQAPESAVNRSEPTNENKGSKESGCGFVAAERGLQLSENVTLDSDVMEENEFIKFRDQGIGGYYVPPSTGSGLVSSELYGPGSGHHMSFSLSALDKAGQLMNQAPVSMAGTMESQGGSPTSINVADDLMNMIQKTRKLEQSEKAWKAFATTLQTELQETKTKLKVELGEKIHNISLLKGENLMLLRKIKKMEHERDALSPADSVSSETAVMVADWVHVPKQQSADPATTGAAEENNMLVLERKLQFLEMKNKQLSQANKDWEAYRRINETTQEERMQELRQNLEISNKALIDHEVKEQKRQREIDKILMTSKSRCQELEDEMEELKYELDQSKEHCKALQEELRHSQQQQMNQLSESAAHQATANVTPTTDSHLEEIVNEKEALKQQLTIFQEDFDKERADRAKAQADKDSLQRQITELTKQLKRAQTQQKTSDETLQSTLSENERLQQQVQTLKRQLRSTEDSLQKCLQEGDQLRQQLQDKIKQIRRQDVVTPPQGGRPYYPPTPGRPQPQNWQVPVEQMYQAVRLENAPELLPGSWQCRACTYVNYPGRTVCEVCGAVNNQQQQRPEHYPPVAVPDPNMAAAYWPGIYGNQGLNQPNLDPNNTMRQQLIPRGRFEGNDLTTDNGGFNNG